MRINIIISGVSHYINFYSTKSDNSFLLNVIIETITKEFSFDLNENLNLSKVQLDNVVNFIMETLMEIYDRWRF
jgi:CTP:phosphocholine cytidylyltransferase-like protein